MKQYLLKRIGVFVSFIFVNSNVKEQNLNEIKLTELSNNATRFEAIALDHHYLKIEIFFLKKNIAIRYCRYLPLFKNKHTIYCVNRCNRFPVEVQRERTRMYRTFFRDAVRRVIEFTYH